MNKMRFLLKLFISLLFSTLSIQTNSFGQAVVPLDLPEFSEEDLSALENQTLLLRQELQDVANNINIIESAREKNSINLLFFEIPCCGKADLPAPQEKELRFLFEKRSIATNQLIEATSIYRGALAGSLTADEAQKRLEESYLGLEGAEALTADATTEIYKVAKKRKIAFKKYFSLPDDIDKKISYFQFDPVLLPNGVEMIIEGDMENAPQKFTGDNLMKFDGYIGPVAGQNFSVEIVYPENVSKENLIFVDDILKEWSGVRKVEKDFKGAVENETAGPECGGIDNRQPTDSKNLPFIGRIMYAGEAICTGFIVDGNLVLTAGHCLTTIKEYNESDNNLPAYDFRNVHFELQVPAKSTAYGEPILSSPEHRFRFETLMLPPNCENCSDTGIFEKEANPDWSKASEYNIGADWAVLKITPAPGNSLNIKQYRENNRLSKIRLIKKETDLSAVVENVLIPGYGKSRIPRRRYTLQTDQGKFTYLNSSASPTQKPALVYDIHTTRGTSGAPILLNRNNKYYAIGIHTHGFCDKSEVPTGKPINVGMPISGNLALAIDENN